MLRVRAVLAWAAIALSADPVPQDAKLLEYEVKSCKHTILPNSLASRAFTTSTGEVHVHDVFGLPFTIKRHVMQLTLASDALLTLQVEVHRDTPSTLNVDVYGRGDSGKGGRRVLWGRNMLGAGGEDTKAFLHGLLSEKDREVDIVFDLVTVDAEASQVDSTVAEAKCWPVRVDLTAVPTARAALHWPMACPAENRLPKPPDAAVGSQVVVLGDRGLSASGTDAGGHFVFRFPGERPWLGFQRALWSGTLEVPPRLHRFVRFFLRASFRFASGPLQLAIELFELKDMPDGSADAPKCAMGCLGGVPVHNGQVVDHAMPTGFRYKLWLLAASMGDWTDAIPDKSLHCLEFDFEYSVRFETKLTPFEVGPAAWMCEFARLPKRIVQSPNQLSTEKLGTGADEYIYGRSIWVRDRFGMPPDEVQDMEHDLEIEVSEPCIFRASTHHSDGVDIRLKFSAQGSDGNAKSTKCRSMKHPGPLPRHTIFCLLQPGMYRLTFYAEYPLGGLHPCSDFFAQVALRPVSLQDQSMRERCVREASDMSSLQVQRNLQPVTQSRWTSIKVPIDFGQKSTIVSVWSQQLVISEQDAQHQLYIRMVLHSDYVSSDLRFQVKYEGRHVADNQVTAHGYADMIGPLDAGTYQLLMYYIAGAGSPSPFQLCSNSLVDLRLISKATYANKTEEWMCTSSRVPLPDTLSPQRDEQILLDSEYLVPSQGRQSITLKVEDARLLRVKATSTDATFSIKVKNMDTKAILSRSQDGIELAIDPGTYSVTLNMRASSGKPLAACSTFSLNLLLIQRKMLPVCPWAPGSSDQSSVAEAQRQASDHIGNVLTDLVPQKISKEMQEHPPVTLWMSQGMSKTIELSLDTSAAVRIDVSVQPPFLPLEVELRKKRAMEKLEAPVATAQWTEHRLLLMYSDLPPGEYQVKFLQPRSYMAFSDQAKQDLSDLCAHLTISAEVGAASKEAVNSMRSELLDLPDLLAVQPFPSSMNIVGWLSGTSTVGTQVYRFKEDVNKATLKLEEKAVLRIISEPADLSNADIQVVLEQSGNKLAASDQLGQLVAELDKGSYDLALSPKAQAPFLVTLGMAYESRLRADLADAGRQCTDTVPDLTNGVDFKSPTWSIGPVFLRLGSSYLATQGRLAKVPISLAVSSVIYLEAGSSLPLDLVRIALQVPEGLWVGEQRGLRNSLEIELPAGKYNVELSQPKPSHLVDDIKRCLDFSVHVRAMPVNPAALEATNKGKTGEEELGTADEAAVQTRSCFSMGTVALPLDLSDPKGGSVSLGGPIKDGRLLIRSNVFVTDMHDGRKKVFLVTKEQPVQLKLGVLLGGYARFGLAQQVSFSVTDVVNHQLVDQTESWAVEDGWERIYNLKPLSQFWLTWHHAHRERTESACTHFSLMLQTHPTPDLTRMTTCPGSSARPEDMFSESLDVTSGSVFGYSKPMQFLSQVQRGFLTNTRLELTVASWVRVEVGYNFMVSHAEMDLVSAKEPDAKPLVQSATEPVNGPGSPINAKLTAGAVLQPGGYTIRVADDHWTGQIPDTSCFPFSFDVTVVPEAVRPPHIATVRPGDSVPLVRGVDVVMTLRFSEPPRGSVEEILRAFSFGGRAATTGASQTSMSSQYGASKGTKAILQASALEGEKVWVLGWSGQALSSLQTAKLEMSGLRGNMSGELFQFNPPSYTIVDAPPSGPWFGGSEAPAASSSGGSVEVAASSAVTADQPVGEMRPEGSSAQVVEPAREGEVTVEGGSPQVATAAGGEGEVSVEGGRPPAVSPDEGEVHVEASRPSETHSSAEEDGEVHIEGARPMAATAAATAAVSVSAGVEESDLPKVEIWDPSAEKGTTTKGSHQAATSVTGHQAVVLLSLGIVAVIGVLLLFPELRRGQSVRTRRIPEPRFRHGVPEEEIGLVSAQGGYHRDEDDIL